jgi:hypothetical protein
MRITIDEQNQELIAYGPAADHTRLKQAIEVLDLPNRADEDTTEDSGKRIHVVSAGDVPNDVSKAITSIFRHDFEFRSINDELLIAGDIAVASDPTAPR